MADKIVNLDDSTKDVEVYDIYGVARQVGTYHYDGLPKMVASQQNCL